MTAAVSVRRYNDDDDDWYDAQYSVLIGCRFDLSCSQHHSWLTDCIHTTQFSTNWPPVGFKYRVTSHSCWMKVLAIIASGYWSRGYFDTTILIGWRWRNVVVNIKQITYVVAKQADFSCGTFSMLHLVYGTNSALIFASLVRHSLLLFLLSHMAVHHLHHLHYHRLHLLLLVQSFILNSRLGSSANPFLHRPFPFLPDWFHRLGF